MQLTTRRNTNTNLPVAEDIVEGAGKGRQYSCPCGTVHAVYNYVSNNPIFNVVCLVSSLFKHSLVVEKCKLTAIIWQVLS